jgi:hypothetical protein
MRKTFLLLLFLSQNALAGGYYYPVPVNPPPFSYVLPPAYIAPPPVYYPQPVYIAPIQRGYYPPPQDGWADSKIAPLPPRVDLSPQGVR